MHLAVASTMFGLDFYEDVNSAIQLIATTIDCKLRKNREMSGT